MWNIRKLNNFLGFVCCVWVLTTQAGDLIGPPLQNTIDAHYRQNYHREDKPEAYWDMAWYARMADYGDKDSQFMLAQAYEKGTQVQRDFEKALYFYRQACQNNQPLACMRLGELYQTKQTLKDTNRALSYYTKAAGMDYIPAQLKLSSLYQETEEMTQAYYWLKRALRALFPDVKDLTTVSPELAYLQAYQNFEEEKAL